MSRYIWLVAYRDASDRTRHDYGSGHTYATLEAAKRRSGRWWATRIRLGIASWQTWPGGTGATLTDRDMGEVLIVRREVVRP